MTEGGHAPVVLDGESLTIGQLVEIAHDPQATVACAPSAVERVRTGRTQIEEIVEEYKRAFATYTASGREQDRPALTYGITTGFGEFRRIPIAPDELESIQTNVLLSHAVGVGDNADPDDPVNYFPADVIRAVMALRLNAFLKGHSGVRVELLECVAAMLNRGVIPLVPTRGSVGSSGDLCPLAHLFGLLVGAGRFYLAGESMLEAHPASALRGVIGIDPVRPTYKEGLALTNGTAFSTALLALTVHDAQDLANTADIAAAMSLEAVCGCSRAFDPKIHDARGQGGQIDSAANIRNMIDGSHLIDRADDIQDAYSLRCAPQVHGASRDVIAFTRMIVHREINAATDNPLFFPGEKPWDTRFRANRSANARTEHAYSAGNFHAQPIGVAADCLAIAVAELANISERRIQMLLDQNHNRNLPANLIPNRGVNSGYMLAQYCAASLVSENKVLAHPASVDSIPTAANAEDHVSMATTASRKARTILANSQAVLAIELLVVAQALEWRVAMKRSPNTLTPPASCDARTAFQSARNEETRMAEAVAPNRRDEIAAALGAGTAAAYQAVRQAAKPMFADRSIDGDIRAVRRVVEDSGILEAVRGTVEHDLRPIPSLKHAEPRRAESRKKTPRAGRS
ncbi:MAG: histidine ammonia-lyase [Phycisphaerae bacterium]